MSGAEAGRKGGLEQQPDAAAAAAQEPQASPVAEQPQPQTTDADETQQQQQQQQQPSCPPPQETAEEAHDENQCHICMSSMREPTAVKGCGHRFCRCCIEQWVGTRQQPACPVCRADVAFLVMADGTEQAAAPAAAEHPSEAEPDLSCLDHSYFLAECARLQSRAQSVHNRVYREAYSCGRRGGAHQTGLVLDGVQDVMDLLAGYRSTLEGEVRFDPQMLLHELYRLDRQLTSLQSGSSDSTSSAAEPAGSRAAADPWQQQAADGLARMNIREEGDYYSHEHDHDHDHDHDYYDYDSADDEDDWHEGLSRTPGRRPTQRHVVKHGRSNSSGGNQQQRQQQQRQQLTPQQRGPIPRWRQGPGSGRQRGGGSGPTGL